MELYWRKNEKEVEKVFDDTKETTSTNDQKLKQKAETTLTDCFQLFS